MEANILQDQKNLGELMLIANQYGKEKEYWLNKLSGELLKTSFPYDYKKTRYDQPEINKVSFQLSGELYSKLMWLSNESYHRLYLILITGVVVLLYKYTGNEDIIVGAPVNRQDVEGEFINTVLALRNQLNENSTFKELLLQVKDTLSEAIENQNYPMEILLDELNMLVLDDGFPLFDTAILLENIQDRHYMQSVQPNMFFSFNVTDESIEAVLEYNSSFYAKATIERIVVQFTQFLKECICNINLEIKKIELLSAAEKHQILYAFNDTKVDYPTDQTLHEIFTKQVEENQDKIAVVDGKRQLTYRELNERANQLAYILREKEVNPDTIVGIMTERSLEMLIGIMAILKAGGAYLPIDPDYPEERIKYILQDSQAKLLLTQKHLMGNDFEIETININDKSVNQKDIGNLECVNTSENLAYVIYTSGSTGKPKGVMVQHNNALNILFTLQNDYPLLNQDAYLLKTNYTFDVSVTELFGWFIGNGKLVILENGLEKDPVGILETIEKYKITHINFTPSILGIFLNFLIEKDKKSIGSLKYLFSAGESLSKKQVDKFNALNTHIQFENIYGPTEATIYSTRYSLKDLHDQTTIPIGKPLSNIKAYIIDKTNQLQPIGVPGELCISGAGVTRGYLNRLDLTAEKFIENPFVSGERMYRTGDLARWLSDGNIEFIERIDQQVKVRGFRIELGEVENQLLKQEAIKEAKVIAREDQKGDKYLCAYFTAEKELTVSELADHLATTLPNYMIPSNFVQMDQLPLTPSGKIDKKRLPEPDGSFNTEVEYETPKTETEKILVELWEEILSVNRKIGINDKFFELGGHSLKATILAARIHKLLNVKVPVVEIFKAATIKELARYIDSIDGNTYSSIKPLEKKEYYSISSAQKRMLIIDKFEEVRTSYNMPFAMMLEGKLDQPRFNEIFKKLVERHEVFRTSFDFMDGDYVQKIHGYVDFEVKYGEAVEDQVEKIMEEFIQLFDFSKAPLFRVKLVRLADQKNLLMLDMHHIISDGTSFSILMQDLIDMYEGKSLPELEVHYKDFTAWQNEWILSGEIDQQERYWLDLFSGEIPVLNFPTDYPRPPIQSFEGDSIVFEIDLVLTEKIKKLSSETDTTLYMILLAAYNVLLFKYTGQKDIIVGSSIAGRQHLELENVIGMFVNALAMRNYPEGQKTFKEFLGSVKESALKAYENQDYQFEELVEKLNIPRDLSSNPLFNTMFDLHNMSMPDITVNHLTFTPYKFGQKIARFDLEFNIVEADGSIIFNLDYCTKLFRRETIERLLVHYINIVKQIVDQPEMKLMEIDIMSGEEKQQILFDFNQTKVDFLKEKTVVDLFREQVEENPLDIAVICKDRQLTYNELDQKSNQVANYLIHEQKITPETIVGILMNRSENMLIAILGIFKAGAVYVPINPVDPEERIKAMLNDAEVQIVISEKRYIRTLNRLQWECEQFDIFLCIDSVNIYMEDEAEKIEAMDEKLWEYIGETATDEITGGGWISSYTGQPISKEEMDEYGDNVLKKLRPILHRKMRVLEIGCASGITMYRIAPNVGFYYGTDLSRVIIEKNRRRVKEEGHQNIALASMPFHEIDKLDEKNFDLIIINSVIQDFHGHNYLRKGIRKAINLLNDQGYLFIGDVMDQDKKENLIEELTEFKCANKDKDYKTKTDWNTELFVSQRFFEDLRYEIPEILDVEFTKKFYTIENELTKFRYDTLIRIDKRENKVNKEDLKHKRQHDVRALEKYSTEDISIQARPENLAYVIYTSGSTGNPKGAMVEHIGMMNHIQAKINELQINKNSIVAQNASHCFDISVWQFLVALMVGGGTVIYSNELILNPNQFINQVIEDQITILEVVPSYLSVMLDSLDLNFRKFESLNYLLVTGEAIKPYLVKRWFDMYPKIKMVNAYGPTEASDDITHHIMDHAPEMEQVPIGKTLQNFKIYIVDENMKLCPIGVKGEICVAGVGVGRGYLNDEERTKNVFIEDPFAEEKGVRLYKTGDLGRWLPDGVIEFFGRKDYQVKIRGFRIELGEIESKLVDHMKIQEAVVLDQEDELGNKYLSAYLVANEELDISEVKEYLLDSLPDYMIPAHFIQLDQIPLTPNGKIDRKSLEKYQEFNQQTNPEYIAPRDQVEKELETIWSEVLGVDGYQIGIEGNFFDLGGHSLKAITILARIHKELNVEVPLAEFFERSTIKELAEYINGAKKSTYFSIEPVGEQEHYLLSSAQKRLYILQQMEEESVVYNMPGVALLIGELDRGKFAETFRKLIKRHESLRTYIDIVDEKPVQKIHSEIVEFEVEYYKADEDTVGEIIRNFVRPFDLSQAPLFRVGLINLGEKRHILMLDTHHIISDGVSEGILMRDFMALYGDEELPELKLQYKDYAEWHNSEKVKEVFGRQEEYWLKDFEGEIPVLNLPTDYTRPLIRSFEGRMFTFELEKEKTETLNKLAKEQDATLYMVLLAAYNLLLSKLSGQEDIVVGTPVAGRRHSDVEEIVGMFVNTLALRNYPVAEKRFKEFLKEVKDRTLQAYENQDYQFEDLVEKLEVKRDTSRNSIFDVMFMLQNFDVPVGEISGLKLGPYEFENKISKFDLTLSVDEHENGLALSFEYSTKLFKEQTIQRMAIYFKKIVNLILDDPEQKISEIEIIDEVEKEQILCNFNQTESEYPKKRVMHQLFEEQVEKMSEDVAVIFEEKSLIYRELNEKANQLAHLLRAIGVKPDTMVGVMQKRSLDLVISILAILKAGGAYLPIDPNYPDARKKFILEDSKAKILLLQKDLVDEENDLLQIESLKVIIFVDDQSIYSGDSSNLEIINNPKDLIYMIYTSGTTGQPKGVMIEHQGAVNYIWWATKNYVRNERVKFPLYTSISFDLTVTSIFTPLITGNTIVVYGEEDKELLIEKIIRENQVEVIKLTPSHLKVIRDQKIEQSNIRRFIVGGEELETRLARDISEKFGGNIEIYNEYGPTETVVGCMLYKFNPENDKGKSVSIGTPANNTKIYILDKDQKVVPIGVAGELYIAGDGVSRGYLNRLKLTAERFIENPFEKGQRLYKTGDLAKWLLDGNVEFLGRIDHQVKIRGFRIELGEIEKHLLDYKEIKEVVVLDRLDQVGEKYLCGYIVAEKEIEGLKLKTYLSNILPDYMIPSHFVQLEKIPLTPNGKINRNALPSPVVKFDGEYIAPRSVIEKTLIELWSEVLGIEENLIGIDANFFELGGHSLKATTFISKLHKERNIKITLMDVFQQSTVRGLAEKIKDARKEEYITIMPVEEKEYYVVSSVQRRLYFLQQLQTDNLSYNTPKVVILEGEIEKEKLEEIFKKLIERHESLRTSFVLQNEEPIQKIHASVEFAVEYDEISVEKAEEKINTFVRPFDLSKAPFFRAGLIKVGKNRHILMLDMHHIITDGTSDDILMKEFMALYAGQKLPKLRLQYKDYSAWQSSEKQKDEMKKQEKFWLQQFAGDIPVLNLPIDYSRPPVQTFDGSGINFEIGHEETEALKRIALEEDATLFMVLLAVYNVCLSKLSGQEDIVVGTSIAGRRHADLQNIVGMFINALALRNKPVGKMTFREFLKDVQDRTLAAYENQDYLLENLVEKVVKKRDLSRNPLFDVMFVLNNERITEMEIPDLKLKPYNYEKNAAQMDMKLRGMEVDEKLIFVIEYSTALFKEDTIEMYVRNFKEIVSAITENIDSKLNDIQITHGLLSTISDVLLSDESDFAF